MRQSRKINFFLTTIFAVIAGVLDVSDVLAVAHVADIAYVANCLFRIEILKSQLL